MTIRCLRVSTQYSCSQAVFNSHPSTRPVIVVVIFDISVVFYARVHATR